MPSIDISFLPAARSEIYSLRRLFFVSRLDKPAAQSDNIADMCTHFPKSKTAPANSRPAFRTGALLLALVFALMGLCGCGVKSRTMTLTAMDTVITLTVYGRSGLLDGCAERILDLEKKLSVTDEASEICALNTNGSAELSAGTAELIRRALEFSAETGGALDITIYPVVRAWGFTTGDYRVPSDSELSALLALVDYGKVELEGNTCRLPEGAMIDLGAVAKGYASDVLAAYLRENGVKRAILNLGGNVYALGAKPGGEPWRVGIADPFGEDYAAVVTVTDKAVVTSGGYQRYFEQDGVTYRHIIDPSTGKPVDNGLASVTVIGTEGLACDALSTALFVMGLDRAAEFWRTHGGFEAVFITSEGEILITSGLENIFFTNGSYKGVSPTVIGK